MTNWWLRASTPERQMVKQYRLAKYAPDAVSAEAVVIRSNALSEFVLEMAPRAVATGEVARALSTAPGQRVDVAGHSLGGHLAMAFSTIFPGNTGQVAVFDAPGFKDSTVYRAVFGKLGGAIPLGPPITNILTD